MLVSCCLFLGRCDILPGVPTISGEEHVVSHLGTQPTDGPTAIRVDHMDVSDGEFLPAGVMLNHIFRRRGEGCGRRGWYRRGDCGWRDGCGGRHNHCRWWYQCRHVGDDNRR